jgi:DNA-binding PadR family transcriptional regulator
MNDPPAILSGGLWELAVLSLLRERPMHPYEIQRLLKARHKDDVLVLKRGSLYHAIKRLAAAGLIHSGKTSRVGRRPERTTYRIAPAGKQALRQWLRRLLSTPRLERSEFMGAISFLMHLDPAQAAVELERRIEWLGREIERLDAILKEARPRIGRIHLIESDYARAMRAAELRWVRTLVDDLRARRFTWDTEALLRAVRSPPPPQRKKSNSVRKTGARGGRRLVPDSPPEEGL